MAEWASAAVLKTVELRGSGGSNPSLSAKLKRSKKMSRIRHLFVFIALHLQTYLQKCSDVKINRLIYQLLAEYLFCRGPAGEAKGKTSSACATKSIPLFPLRAVEILLFFCC